MCGIAGIVGARNWTGREELVRRAQNMADRLSHRGPDDQGVWIDERRGVALSHRRLAVIDLSPLGHQPMTSRSGRYTIVFNGEIYNFGKLRLELTAANYAFRGRSDTEVLLAAMDCWGLRDAVERLIGMFAFAVWDRDEEALYLVRDRLGVKPLFFGKAAGQWAFASEISAIEALDGFNGTIDAKAIQSLLQTGSIRSPLSIYEEICQLKPGFIARVTPGGQSASFDQYWSISDVVNTASLERYANVDEEEVLDELQEVLTAAIRDRMVADVPLGAFLSGGIDSSCVVSIMQSLTSERVKTFTIGFSEATHDEAPTAARIAEHIGTDHTSLYISESEALEITRRIPDLFDQPFADSSQIPTYLVSRLAAGSVTVTLSGDGGDELFYGYSHYRRAMSLHRTISYWPTVIKRAVAGAIRTLGPQPYSRLCRLKGILEASGNEQFYRAAVSQWPIEPSIVFLQDDHSKRVCVFDMESKPLHVSDIRNLMMQTDLVGYLPDDILTKVDRASMAVSLEARVPILDHRVVEFAVGLPIGLKDRGTQGKYLLRRLLNRYLPAELTAVKKKGFSVPLDRWLRGPLRDWAEELLNPARLRSEGLLAADTIRSAWNEHLLERRNLAPFLWNVLMIQAWLCKRRS